MRLDLEKVAMSSLPSYLMVMVLVLSNIIGRVYARCDVAPNKDGHVVWDVSIRGTSVRQYAFSGCLALKSISFTNGYVTQIESSAFSQTKLESITLPDSVIRLGASAFFLCTNLQTVNLGTG
uniref:Uncharacterized protein n=1 Tax=uncultured organism MedDCM-OCT-S08-C695 TaxID=743640 RepID=D6PJA7_9ZZZZ|nr:hypothetical protein [uncultured organism MedDCM-OCT-S08-C695]